MGDSSAVLFRCLGRGVAGRSGTAKTGSGAKIDSAAASLAALLADDVVAFETRAFLFFGMFAALEEDFAGSLVYSAGPGVVGVVEVEMRTERRSDIVNSRCRNASSCENGLLPLAAKI